MSVLDQKDQCGISAIISGKVQGVYFRANTKEIAKSLHLTGWVKNLDNGDVEVLAFGSLENIQKLSIWLEQGPNHARVDDLQIKKIEFQNLYKSFEIN